MNIEKVIVFSLSSEWFALPIQSVREVVRAVPLNPVPGSSELIEGVINLRGRVIPICNLEKRLGMTTQHVGEFSHFVIMEIGENTFGIEVDDVSEVMGIDPATIQTVSESLATKIDTRAVAGVIVRDTRLILLLNADTIFVSGESKEIDHTHQTIPTKADV